MNFIKVVSVLAFCTLYGGLADVKAVPPNMNLSKAPLFLNSAVDPNLVMTFDDSGSMQFAYLPDAVDAPDCAWRYKRYYSSKYNKLYYNPSVSYEPPLNALGTRYPDSVITAARIEPFAIPADTSTLNLSTTYQAPYENIIGGRITYNATATLATAANGVFPDTRTGCYIDGNRGNNPPDPRLTFKFPHPANNSSPFYCNYTGPMPGTAAEIANDANYTCVNLLAAQQTNFANWFTYYRQRSLALKTAVSRSFGNLDDNIQVTWQNMRASPLVNGTTTIGRFASTRRAQFFDWLFDSPSSGNTPTLASTKRVGEYFKQTGGTTTNPYWDATLNTQLSCRQNFHVLVTDGYWNENNHAALSFAGNNAIKTAKTLPDGRTFSVNAGDTAGKASQIVWNEAARVANQCTDNNNCTPSYSDVAFHYWSTDLRTDLTDNVPRFLSDRTVGVSVPGNTLAPNTDPWLNEEVYFNPANDSANWQHLTQFFIGFGIDGTVPYNDTEYVNRRNGTSTWPYPRNNDARAVDDSWHAAMVSRGKYFTASDPNALVQSLTGILNNIVARRSTGSALTVSSGIITSDALSFQTRFDSSDWSGTVLARSITTNFVLGTTPTWDAGCLLTGGTCSSGAPSGGAGRNWDTDRVIITSNAPSGTNTGVPFRNGSLSTAQLNALNINPTNNLADGLGNDRLKYIRGDRTRESLNGGTFRNRSSVLGAIIHSEAVVVVPPNTVSNEEIWPVGSPEDGASYRSFRVANASRPKMIYVGANDGMMHAFDALTGQERWAYVPYAVHKNLNKLTDPIFNFEPFVDLTPSAGDVFINGSWRTVLVGGLRRGGKGIYALDITNATATESGAANKVLWEFSDSDASKADLGYTYGKPFIARLNTGDWAVLVPGGYFSHEADGTVGSGNAVMFVLRLSDGSLIRKFDLGTIDVDAQGLTSPMGVSLNDFNITDIAYAGDLKGNIWRFNLTGSAPASWSVAKFYSPKVAFAKPITAQPRIMNDVTTRQIMVMVGTGKYVELNDRSPLFVPAATRQAFLSVRDDALDLPNPSLAPAVIEDNLDKRSVVSSSANARTISLVTPAPSGVRRGWQLVFNDTNFAGERVVSDAIRRPSSNRVLFTTLVTSGVDPCVTGGNSFLMAVNASTGGPPSESDTLGSGAAAFDTNNDGRIDENDNNATAGVSLGGVVPGGASVVAPGGGVGAIITPTVGNDAAGGGAVTITTEFDWRRRSWNELHPKK